LGVDIFELSVAIGMFAAFLGLAVEMAAIFQFLQQFGNGRGAHLVTHRPKRPRQLVVALGDPSQRPHRIAHRRGLEQSLQVLQKRRVPRRQPRAPPALATHLPGQRAGVPQVLQTASNRASGDLRRTRGGRDPAVAGRLRLGGGTQPSASLVKRGTKRFKSDTEVRFIYNYHDIDAALEDRNPPIPNPIHLFLAVALASQRLELETSLGKAVMWSKGFATEEAKAAFTRAQEHAASIDNSAERFDIYYGLWVGSLLRGELGSARETAEKFLREAEREERIAEAMIARRILGLASLFQGDLAIARAHFEQALRMYAPGRDHDAKFRFGMDTRAVATAYLAHTNWQIGEVERTRELMEASVAHATESAHAPTLAHAYHFKALFEVFRGDAVAGQRAAEAIVELSREYNMQNFLAQGFTLLQLGARSA